MKSDAKQYHITEPELAVLGQIALADGLTASVLSNKQPVDNGTYSIRMDKAESQHLREQLTVRLAKVGFEDDYSLSGEGKILEQLIDKVYEP